MILGSDVGRKIIVEDLREPSIAEYHRCVPQRVRGSNARLALKIQTLLESVLAYELVPQQDKPPCKATTMTEFNIVRAVSRGRQHDCWSLFVPR